MVLASVDSRLFARTRRVAKRAHLEAGQNCATADMLDHTHMTEVEQAESTGKQRLMEQRRWLDLLPLNSGSILDIGRQTAWNAFHSPVVVRMRFIIGQA